MLKVENLVKTYNRNMEFNAVDNVNLEIKDGSFVVIIGKSGSGKSTLLNLISGVIAPTIGNVIFDEYNFSNLTDEEISKIRNEKIGFIPQMYTTLSNLNVINNICLPYYIYKNENTIEDRGKYLLKELGIEKLENSYPNELSGGELRRVTIARALINYPKLILADEPTSDLDVGSTEEVLKIFKKINKDLGVTIIMVTHDLKCLEYADIVYTMESGKLILDIIKNN